jgi:predicted Zn-dependent protease
MRWYVRCTIGGGPRSTKRAAARGRRGSGRANDMLSRTIRPAVSALVLLAFAACVTNPATGRREFSLMSEEQEIELGKQFDGEVRREMGLYEDPELQRYVSGIGMRLAQASERPQLPWHFAVVDEPAINAFALPGGYIYLTRGILPFLHDEAQLAGVLGHEIGHVTARHSAQRYTQVTTAGVGVTLLSIFVPEARPLQGLTETALGLMFLRYGREDELQADRLGVDYTSRTGWDPAGVGGMLHTLARLEEADGSRRGVPNWLSTHPAPADRVQQVQAYIAQVDRPVGTKGTSDPAEFLRRIDGLVFGDSPRQGIVRGHMFLHPDLRLSIAFPQGWEMQNSPSQVVASAPDRGRHMLLQLVPKPSGTIEQVARGSMAQAGFQHIGGQRTQINGLDAYVGTYRGTMQNLGTVSTLAAHIVHDRNVYVLAGLAPPDRFQAAEGEFAASIRSFRSLSAQEAAGIRPNRVDVYTVRQGDSWEAIAKGPGAGLMRPSTLAIMNNYEPNQPPRTGDRIKIIVEG